jgi:hypothetical protein
MTPVGRILMPLHTKASRTTQYIPKTGCAIFQVQEWIKCLYGSDCRRVLDWQLDLLDYNTVTLRNYKIVQCYRYSTHITIHYSTYCILSAEPLHSPGPRTSLQTHSLLTGSHWPSTKSSLQILHTNSELNSATTTATNSYGIPCHH